MTISSWRRASTASVLASLFVFAAGCTFFKPPHAAPTGDRAPVALRNLQITSDGAHRAVLLRLTRVPTAVRHSTDYNQIIVEAYGPPGEGDLPEKALPQDDPYIRQVRVSRQEGTLRIILDLYAETPPEHQVHEMADWVMVRFGELQQ